MALIKNTLKKQLSISDEKGAVFINPSDSVELSSDRFASMKKNSVNKSYFDLGYLVESKAKK